MSQVGTDGERVKNISGEGFHSPKSEIRQGCRFSPCERVTICFVTPMSQSKTPDSGVASFALYHR